MTTTLEFLNQVYEDVKADYTDSCEKEDALVLVNELILSLTNLNK